MDHSGWVKDAEQQEESEGDADKADQDGGGRLGDHVGHHLLRGRQRRDGSRGGRGRGRGDTGAFVVLHDRAELTDADGDRFKVGAVVHASVEGRKHFLVNSSTKILH